MHRRRVEERRVAGLFLFAPDALRALEGRRRTRLLRSPSLLLECLAALALALVLADLRVGDAASASHLVLVLDGSASMGGAGRGETTAAEAARRAAEEAIDDLPGGGRATVVVTGARPEVVAGPRATPGAARDAVRAWRPSRPDHDPAPALDLGLQLAGPPATLLFATDRLDREAPARYRVVALGGARGNAAIVGVRRARGSGTDRVHADVAAFAESPLVTTVTVADARGTVLAERRTTLEPGRTAHLSLDVPASDDVLEIRLSPDALALDDRALLLPEPSPAVGVEVALDAETARAAEIERALAAVGGVRSARGADARLRFSTAPAASEEGFSGVEVLFDATAEHDPWVGPFRLERHPALRGVRLDGVVWDAYRIDPPGAPLVAAGERTLLSEERTADGVRFHLNLEPRRSNLPRSPDWPILVGNLVSIARTTLPGPERRNVRVGGEIAFRAPSTRDRLDGWTLVAPSGARRTSSGVGSVSFEAAEPGVHRLLGPDGAEVARYAVQFVDPAESDLSVRSSGGRAPDPAFGEATSDAAEAGARDDAPAARVLALLLVGLLVADWAVLGGRRARRGKP
jgi:hypothetical protein